MNFSKKTRGFTLVEMLIVIVIIGVLAAALIPRLTSVRGRANDVARKADLQQVATAILSYSMDNQNYPTSSGSISVGSLTGTLIPNYVTSLPTDPQGSSSMSEYPGITGEYVYINTKKGNVANAGFIIIAKSETPGGANRAFSTEASGYLSGGVFDANSDSQLVTPCSKITLVSTGFDLTTNKDDCKYTSPDQLRYIIAR